MKNLTRFTPGTRNGLTARLAEAFTVDFSVTYPLYYALGVLTGYPGYPVLPVVVAASPEGLTVSTVDGYYVVGVVPLTVSLTLGVNGYGSGNRPAEPGAPNYYAALGLLRALPTRLTVSALEALGGDFSLSGITDGPVATPGTAISLTPFSKADWYSYSGATPAPNGNPPLIAEVPTPNAYGGATVIADANGVEIYLYTPNANALESVDAYAYAGRLNAPNAETDGAYAFSVAVAGGLTVASLTPEFLSAVGFLPFDFA